MDTDTTKSMSSAMITLSAAEELATAAQKACVEIGVDMEGCSGG